MGVRTAFWGLAVLLGAVLAGCTESGDVKSVVAFDADTGGIRGAVLTEEQLPIPGAVVRLTDSEGNDVHQVETPDVGVFTFNRINPGDYALIAQASGFVSAQKPVTVRAGELVEGALFTLTALASDAPYHTTNVFPLSVSGYAVQVKSPVPFTTVPGGPHAGQGDSDGCIFVGESATLKSCQGSRSDATGGNGCEPSGSCEIHFGHCGTPEGEWGDDWANYGCDFGHGWKTIISELTSVPQTATTGQGWAFTTFAPNVTRSGCPDNCDTGSTFFDDPRNFRTTSTAPIYRWIDEAVLVERGVEEQDWCCDWGWRLFPAPCAIGGCDFYANADVMTDQSATVYWTYFMREPAPEGWSAVEDV